VAEHQKKGYWAMEYRKLGRTGLEVSAIGLGTEHLEQTRETMAQVLDLAVEAGVNYVDLLYDDPEGAPDFWDNLAPAMRPYRERLVLAAHWGWGPGHNGDLDGAQRCLDQVLTRVGGYAELGIVATIDTEEQWDGWGREAVQRLARYVENGRIGHIAMSGHFTSTALKAVQSGLIDVLMYGINLTEHGSADLDALCAACVAHDVGVVAMKPYYGGALLNYDGRPTGIAPSQCLAYTLSRPVATAIPGVKNAAELRAALHYLEASQTERDWQAAIPLMHEGLAGHCTRCNHCLPCPAEIDIGQTILYLGFTAWDGVTDWLQGWYDALPSPASACVECGVCEERCPFGVEIVDKMREAAELFEGRAA
jgi:predicted aldo/keto reductase-like oxidoreductase